MLSLSTSIAPSPILDVHPGICVGVWAVLEMAISILEITHHLLWVFDHLKATFSGLAKLQDWLVGFIKSGLVSHRGRNCSSGEI